ncbi:hypothetical protein K469DRAFT_551939, partial [Zopfia rhizophila CBS 207.26]
MWLRKCQGTARLDIQRYLEEFSIKAERCIQAGAIEDSRKGFYLVKGLPKYHAQKVLAHFDLRSNEPSRFKYQDIANYLLRRVQVESEVQMLSL